MMGFNIRTTRLVWLTVVSITILVGHQSTVAATRGVEGQCPTAVCACKWKGGKQTVECLGHGLITIPESIDPSTQVLDMSGNNLQIITRETFLRAGLLNLQKVYLRKCRLGQIDDEAFKGLTNLVDLDLSDNLLTFVPSATLSHVASLRDLSLASNPIQKIESHAFAALIALTKLDLSHCEIQSIAPQAFESVVMLNSLKLNGNRLSELRPRTVETLSKLQNVELHDNPWLCNCRLRAAKIWLTTNNIPSPISPVCSGGPERVIDRTFAELQIDDFACKPEMLPVRRYIDATMGENATIVCRAAGIPAASVNWYWNGRLLLNNSAFSSYQRVYVYEDGEFERRSRLVLTNAQETDSSEFYCVAENRAGNAEANFTLHVGMRAAGMASLGSGQIVGLSAALVILILCILLVILFLLVRLRRVPFSESKTPASRDTVITTVSPQINANGKQMSTSTINDVNSPDRKAPNDLKLANPVQKPPRLTDISYSTSHYDANGSIILSAGAHCYASPTASSGGNNPDLIADTARRLGSGGDLASALSALDHSSSPPPPPADPDPLIERSGSGEYSRAGGCDSLYPSGLWESGGAHSQPLEILHELYLKRVTATVAASNGTSSAVAAAAAANPPYSAYSDRTPIMNLDDEHSSAEFMFRTFPRTAHAHQHMTSVGNGGGGGGGYVSNSGSSIGDGSSGGGGGIGGNVGSGGNVGGGGGGVGISNATSGYPSDYGLPIVPGAEQIKPPRDCLPPSMLGGIPTNAKTLRVWQRGGVPVLPPVNALKRALTSSRNSPDEGYQEGCGTDV